MAEQHISGIAAARGIAVGPAYLIRDAQIEIDRRRISDPVHEVKRLVQALDRAREEIEALRVKAEAETSPDEAAIFDAHAMFLQDPALSGAARQAIRAKRVNAEAAWVETVAHQAKGLRSSESEYIRERAADLLDVGNRVTRLLIGALEEGFAGLRTPSIIIARDLTPSDTIRLDKQLVLAFCTEQGGPTSHTAILARSLGIPAVVGLGDGLLSAASDRLLAVDGDRGRVIIDPSDETRQALERSRQAIESQRAQDWERAHEPAVTRDGRRVEVVANVGRTDEARLALAAGAEGIGLLRTEFLYMERSLAPSEEEQTAAYQEVLETMEERRVIVRTLDIGGDKKLPYIQLTPEENPFLGVRALRLCFERPDLMGMQLRSLLRASPGHQVHLMFPMVATLEELRRARAAVEAARHQVRSEGHEVQENIPIGIMVEIPSVAVMADQFAREVDFFSIGTNDLTQYTFAAERTNAKVAHLTDAFHPAILRLIHQVVQAAHEAGIWAGICGELAGDPDAIPILLGLELDELSMAANAIPRAKAIIRSWSFAAAAELARAALTAASPADVRELVRQHGQ